MARFTGPTSASSSKSEDQSGDCAAPHGENSGEQQPGAYRCEWFNPVKGESGETGSIENKVTHRPAGQGGLGAVPTTA